MITNWVTNTAVNGTIIAAMTAPKANFRPAKSSLARAYPAAEAATTCPATTISATTTLSTRPPKPWVSNSPREVAEREVVREQVAGVGADLVEAAQRTAHAPREGQRREQGAQQQGGVQQGAGDTAHVRDLSSRNWTTLTTVTRASVTKEAAEDIPNSPAPNCR